MANLVAVADGNFNSNTPWRSVDTTATLISTNTGSTALTTGNLDSAAFVLAANEMVGMMVRIASRATGSPSNTMTVHLRNSTTATNARSVTVNVSDLPQSSTGTDSEGGWIYLQFSSSLTPNGTDSYLIRATLSATSTAVSLATNGTPNNWQRLVVRSATATPAAGDDLFISGLFDGASNPATTATRTVTMDQTASTDYGAASTNQYTAAINISTRGVLVYGTTAATNYLLRVSGHVAVFRNGTLTLNPASDGSAVLEFDCATDSDFALLGKSGSIINLQGDPRTPGKNVFYTLLTADQSAAATSATVADDTGWKNGDEVGLASTTKTVTQREKVTLSADAGASSLSHGAVTNARGGSASAKVQAEAVLITRNVIIRSVTSTAQAFIELHGVGAFDADWVLFRYLGGGVQSCGLRVECTSGSVALSYCCLSEGEERAFLQASGSTTLALTIEHTSFWNNATVSNLPMIAGSGTALSSGASVAINDVVIIGGNSNAGAYGVDVTGWTGLINLMSVTTLRAANVYHGIYFHLASPDYGAVQWGPFVVHSCAAEGVRFGDTGSGGRNFRCAAITSWRNSAPGILFDSPGLCSYYFEGAVHCFGNTTAGLRTSSNQRVFSDVRFFAEVKCSGDSTFAQAVGLETTNDCVLWFSEVDFGTATGIYVAHSTADVSITGLTGPVQIDLGKATLASTTEFDNPFTSSFPAGSYISMMRKDGSTGAHSTRTPFGIIARETTTVDVSPGVKMTPNVATTYALRLESGARRPWRGYLASVASGGTATVSVQVQIDASYNGNPPRLILKANAAAGINADVVLDTHSGATGSFETLSGTTAAVSDDAVLEFVVDCNGTAGNCFVDTWTGGGDGSQQYWADGLPSSAGVSDVGGSPGSPEIVAVETGFASVG